MWKNVLLLILPLRIEARKALKTRSSVEAQNAPNLGQNTPKSVTHVNFWNKN